MSRNIQLEREFHSACVEAINAAEQYGYDPTAWLAMIDRHGAAEAARRLLASGDTQTGFARLIELGRPDLTVEWAALDDAWAPLFHDVHRRAARWRLVQAGVELPDSNN
jgi:hypothetical protein